MRTCSRTRSSDSSARWSTRTSCSSRTPAAGRLATGCWKPSDSMPRGNSKAWARRRPMMPATLTETTTWLSRRRRHHSWWGTIRPNGWTVSIWSSAISGPRSATACNGEIPRPESGWPPRCGSSGRTRGHAAEGIDALHALLDLPAPGEQPLLRARGLTAVAYLLEQTGGYATAEEYCEEGLAIARAAGDDYLIADLLYLRALVLLRRGQPDQALPIIESGLGLARQHKEPHLIAHLLAATVIRPGPAGRPRRCGPRRPRIRAAVPPGR